MKPIKHILLVGHCGFDAPRLRQMVEEIAPDAKVDEADMAEDAQEAGSDTLLLINRQLGGGFHTRSGIELIRELAAKNDPPAMMLVSNYADAQQEAEEAGALPGFGKSALHNPETHRRLREAIQAAPAKAPARKP